MGIFLGAVLVLLAVAVMTIAISVRTGAERRMDRTTLKHIYFYLVSIISLFIILWAVIRLGQHVVNLALPLEPETPIPKAPDVTLPDQNFYRVQELRGLINTLITIVVTTPIYIYHWRLARKADKIA